MSSLPILTSDSVWLVVLRSEFCPLKFPHWFKCLPVDEGSFFAPGDKIQKDLLFPLGKTGVFRKTSLLPIPKRRVEV